MLVPLAMAELRLLRLPPAGADERWAVLEQGQEAARCGLWWRQVPIEVGERCGCLGEFQAAAATDTARLALLRHGCERLRRQGCRQLLAPMAGSSWHDYRLVATGTDGAAPQPPFAGEPGCGPDWLEPLRAAGFVVRSRYVSALCTDLAWRRPRNDRLRAAASTAALSIRSAGEVEAAALLPGLHQLVMAGFRRQPWFAPVDPARFVRLAQGWWQRQDPQLSLLAFDADQLVGLLLAHADPPGPAPSRLVVRTLVVSPGRRYAGLGRELLERAHARAALRGCTAAIHALMHNPGPSVALSRPYARVFRHYLLMGRSLGAPGDQG